MAKKKKNNWKPKNERLINQSTLNASQFISICLLLAFACQSACCWFVDYWPGLVVYTCCTYMHTHTNRHWLELYRSQMMLYYVSSSVIKKAYKLFWSHCGSYFFYLYDLYLHMPYLFQWNYDYMLMAISYYLCDERLFKIINPYEYSNRIQIVINSQSNYAMWSK